MAHNSQIDQWFLNKVKSGILDVRQDGSVFNNKTKREIGSFSKKGYKKICMADGNGKILNMQVHRLMWITFKGDIPQNFEVVFKNGLRSDVRLENLELLTPSQKYLKVKASGKPMATNGSIQPAAVFKDEDVPNIRTRVLNKELSVKQVCEQFKCTRQTVISMLKGNTYGHIQGAIKYPLPFKKSSRRVFLAYHMRKQRLYLSYISKKLLISTSTVKKYASEYDSSRYDRDLKVLLDLNNPAMNKLLSLHRVKGKVVYTKID
jgi:hypothetical protein